MPEDKETISFDLKNLSTSLSILLVGIMVSLALFFGLRSSGSSGEVSGTAGAPPSQPIIPQAPQEQPSPQTAKTSIDDDPILGDEETATVAIIEFSDYECPFCKRFADETLPRIKKNYIDTGKAVLVFRDLPLPFHNPAAEREAIAAECAREQGGDSNYFEYHDEVFETTTGNGQGIDIDGLAEIAEEIGLDGNKLKICLEEENFKDEVKKDAEDAAKAGISGTPGFVVGKLAADGVIEGILVVGAHVFQNAIEQQLN